MSLPPVISFFYHLTTVLLFMFKLTLRNLYYEQELCVLQACVQHQVEPLPPCSHLQQLEHKQQLLDQSSLNVELLYLVCCILYPVSNLELKPCILYPVSHLKLELCILLELCFLFFFYPVSLPYIELELCILYPVSCVLLPMSCILPRT